MFIILHNALEGTPVRININSISSYGAQNGAQKTTFVGEAGTDEGYWIVTETPEEIDNIIEKKLNGIDH
jgi:hypothetical protein